MLTCPLPDDLKQPIHHERATAILDHLARKKNTRCFPFPKGPQTDSTKFRKTSGVADDQDQVLISETALLALCCNLLNQVATSVGVGHNQPNSWVVLPLWCIGSDPLEPCNHGVTNIGGQSL